LAKTLKVTETGDMDFTGNSFSIITDSEELNQSIKSILSIRKGEWFLDTEFGLSHENLIGAEFDEDKIELDVREALSNEERIETIESISASFDTETRKVTISFRVTAGTELIEDEVII